MCARDAGIALLDIGEQTFFGGEQNAGAVDVDGAAFENEALAVNSGLEGFHLEKLGDVRGNFVVVMPVRIFSPGVEAPVSEGNIVFCILYENRAGVTQPDAVSAPAMEAHTGEVGVMAREHARSAFFGGGIVDEDVDVFDVGEMADDFAIDPRDGLEFPGPVLRIVGPGDPCGGVRRPLGGHAVALLLWC